MTAAAAGPRYAAGWALSVLAHVALVAAAMVVLSDLRLAPQPEPFRWDVSVVRTKPSASAQAQSDTVSQAAESPTPPAAPPAPLVPPTSQPLMSAVASPSTATARVHAPTSSPASAPAVPSRSRSPRTDVSPAPQSSGPITAHQDTPSVPSASAPTLATPPPTPVPTTFSSVAEPPARDRTIARPTDTGHTPDPLQERTTRTPDQSMPTAEADHSAPADEAPTVARAQPSTPGVQHENRDPPGESRPAEDRDSSSSAPSEAAKGFNMPPEAPRDGRRPVHDALALATKPDFGWLGQMLASQFAASFKYPPDARMLRLEGRVVLRVTVKESGELTVEIQESSGHKMLDQAAVDAYQRLSPIKLDHPLGRSHVRLLQRAKLTVDDPATSGR